MRPRLAFVAAALSCVPVVASEPGQPLDCSDWVFSVPGLSCESVGLYPCEGGDGYVPGPQCMVSQNIRAFDNSGGVLSVRDTTVNIGCAAGSVRRLELRRFDGISESVIGTLEGRCNGPAKDELRAFTGRLMYESNQIDTSSALILFDSVNGALLVSVHVFCVGTGCQYPGDCGAVGCIAPTRVFKIRGFATLFETVQSYVPQNAALGFHVPVMPEGMPGADHFDTYYGPLTKPINFTEAHPLACDFPSSPPAVGDYLAITDTVPTPPLGQGVYYVTAATYQGQTRYGRKTSAGVLSGRDPALLPACMIEGD